MLTVADLIINLFAQLQNTEQVIMYNNLFEKVYKIHFYSSSAHIWFQPTSNSSKIMWRI